MNKQVIAKAIIVLLIVAIGVSLQTTLVKANIERASIELPILLSTLNMTQ